MPFEFRPLEIPDVIEITSQVFSDERGAFAELFKASEFQVHGLPGPFVQVNYSRSGKGVLRGLHFQRHPKAQAKLIAVARGEIFDVAVDIRPDSTTYKQWVGVTLSSEKKNMLWVPAGFAHGFQVLSEVAEVMYFVAGREYAPDSEAGIAWNDPGLGIDWPIADPILSEKDKRYPVL